MLYVWTAPAAAKRGPGDFNILMSKCQTSSQENPTTTALAGPANLLLHHWIHGKTQIPFSQGWAGECSSGGGGNLSLFEVEVGV